MINIPQVWFGGEESLARLLVRMEVPVPQGWLENRNAQLFGAYDDEEDERVQLSMEDRMALELIEVYDSVGVIEVKGSLVDDESPFNSWFDAVGYPTIARAVSMLTEDEGISDIVISYNTGGGSASGIGELSSSIEMADTVKPVYSWTGSSALSAGYWLATSGRKFYATKMAEVGSVGAISTFTSVARMLKERGIDVHIARSTPNKGVPHPMEPISEKGKEKMQDSVEALHGFFIDQVIANRPQLSSEGSKESWASGDTFFAQQALGMGMIDGPLMPLNELIADLNSKQQTTEDPTMPKHVVLASEQDRARLAAGAPITTTLEETAPLIGTPEGEATVAAVLASAPAEAGTETPAAASEGASLETPAASSESLSAYLREEIDGLRSDLAARDARIAELTTEAEGLRLSAAGREQLRPIAERSVERLHVALGHRALALETLPDASLAGLFGQLNTELEGLPIGQQSVQAESPRENLPENVDDVTARRLSIVPSAG